MWQFCRGSFPKVRWNTSVTIVQYRNCHGIFIFQTRVFCNHFKHIDIQEEHMDTTTYSFSSGKYTQMFVLAKRGAARVGSVWVRACDEGHTQTFYFKFDDYEPCTLKLKENTQYEIGVQDCAVELAYFCGNYDVLRDGVMFAKFGETLELYTKENLADLYTQTYRNQFHFAPTRNWLNDPNGVCWFQGYYHLFYQYNPVGQKWGNPYWGHAVSQDLVHWTHLPIVLFPQVDLISLEEYQGGAYSGCAVVQEDHIQFVFTRHIGRKDRGWQRQWQCTAETYDGVHFVNERPLITATPRGVYYDFRDPKVEWIDGKWRMVVAGKVDDKPAGLLYNSYNLQDWEYSKILLEDPDPHYAIAECPDIFELDGKTVLIVGYVTSDEVPQGSACKTRRVTCYYIGSFADDSFHLENHGILDWGQDFYAAQSFRRGSRRILYAWNNDSPQTHIPEPDGSNGSISIPRELHVVDGHLYSNPVPEIMSLVQKNLADAKVVTELQVTEHQTNCYMLTLDQIMDQPFCLELTRQGEEAVSLRYQNGTAHLHCGADNDCSCRIGSLKKVQIFMDRALVEIFLNDGQESFNRRYYFSNPEMRISLQAKQAMNCRVDTLDRIWNG